MIDEDTKMSANTKSAHRQGHPNLDSSADIFDPSVVASVGFVLSTTRTALFSWMARDLKKRFDSAAHLYVRNEQELNGYQHLLDDGTYKTISIVPVVADLALEPVEDRDQLLSDAQKLEQQTGLPFGMLAMSTRYFSRGYFAGAVFNKRPNFLSKTDDLMILSAHCKLLNFWSNEIRTKELTLLLDADMYAASICRANKVPVRILEPGRLENRMLWSVNERRHTPQIRRAYDSITADFPSADLSVPYAAPMAKYKRFWAERGTFAGAAKNSAKGLARGVYYRLRRYDIARRIKIYDRVVTPWRFYLRTKRAQRACTTTLAQLRGRRFAYFPMHKEPELWNVMRSPECFNQMAVIQAIARDLPAGTLLAIKENLYSTSFRPAHYYDQLLSIPNVVLLDIRENSINCIQQADVTVTISGSAGMEAAVLGKPAIVFSQNIDYGFMPHVKIVTTSGPELRQQLNWAFDAKIKSTRAKQDGARYLEAIRRVTFDAGGFRLSQDKRQGADEQVAERAVQNLIDGLDEPHIDDPAERPQTKANTF